MRLFIPTIFLLLKQIFRKPDSIIYLFGFHLEAMTWQHLFIFTQDTLLFSKLS